MQAKAAEALTGGDLRRPCGWDWLGAFFAAIPTIAYHHRRASLSLTHVFVLVLSCFASGVMVLTMSISLMRDLVKKVILGDAGLVSSGDGVDLKAFKSLQKAFVSFSQLPAEERNAILGRLMAQSQVLSAAVKGASAFGWILIGFAFYVVFMARLNTKQAQRAFVEGSLGPAKTYGAMLESPKGRGPAWMLYSIAVMVPPVSYAIHCNHRLSFLGVSILASFLTGLFYLFSIAFFSLDVSFKEDAAGVGPLLNFVLLVMLLAPMILYILGPVRMAVINVRDARAAHARTAAISE